MRIVLFLYIMREVRVTILYMFVLGFLFVTVPATNGGSGAQPARPEAKDLSVRELMEVLNRANLLAQPYYNGVPDPAAVGRGYGETKRETRGEMMARLSKIIIREIPSDSFDGISLKDAVPVLSRLINQNNLGGLPINIYVNQFLRGSRSGSGAAGSGAATGIPNMGLGGLPGGGGAGMGGMPGGGGIRLQEEERPARVQHRK